MLLGDEFSASQALAWGLVGEVVESEAQEAAAWRTCERLAALAPEVARRFKKVLNEIGLASFERAITLENEAQRSLGAR